MRHRPQTVQPYRTVPDRPDLPAIGYHVSTHPPNQSPAVIGTGRTTIERNESAQVHSQLRDAGTLSERIAHIEAKMDFVATREDIALVRREIEGTRTEIANTNARIAEMSASKVVSLASSTFTCQASFREVHFRKQTLMAWTFPAI